MRKIKDILYVTIVLLLFNNSVVFSQINILTANISQYNITPLALCDASIFNGGQEVLVVLEATLSTHTSKPLVKVVSKPFTLKNGMNTNSGNFLQIEQTKYANDDEANYIQSNRLLPPGNYVHCIVIKPFNGNSEGATDFCQDISSEEELLLNLVYPADRDTIETLYPVFLWNHGINISFSTPGESYRMILTELREGQPAEAGIRLNVPVFYDNNLRSHQVPYPLEANALVKGKSYSWQVQRLVGGSITQSTEVWQFYLKEDMPFSPKSCVIPKTSLDEGYYMLEGDTLFFKFEAANTGDTLLINLSTGSQTRTGKEVGTIPTAHYCGSNYYAVDIEKLKLRKGSHVMEILDRNGNRYFIRFYIN